MATVVQLHTVESRTLDDITTELNTFLLTVASSDIYAVTVTPVIKNGKTYFIGVVNFKVTV
jgi:hypothetical protein